MFRHVAWLRPGEQTAIGVMRRNFHVNFLLVSLLLHSIIYTSPRLAITEFGPGDLSSSAFIFTDALKEKGNKTDRSGAEGASGVCQLHPTKVRGACRRE